MSRTITFQPSPELSAFIEAQIETGGFASQSEVVRAGLRLLQEQTAASKLQQLRRLIEEGETSGEPIPWDVEGFLAKVTKDTDGSTDD
ncbi:type II toxin-antitoxin system ParD family antitoxin [Saccharospirillum salsuginis]|uniref:Antitoxin ParD n=1 Tax=Saccharospirillum salsuginis TaxID=418750 RepID=A0A918NFE4_9GAMM|nr:type II toxin-antitoxin system ParD family antitoxin [Saccharospirillum salsuginis]GGX66485.1 antitoxin [Saccharospirillum salsuginis]